MVLLLKDPLSPQVVTIFFDLTETRIIGSDIDSILMKSVNGTYWEGIDLRENSQGYFRGTTIERTKIGK